MLHKKVSIRAWKLIVSWASALITWIANVVSITIVYYLFSVLNPSLSDPLWRSFVIYVLVALLIAIWNLFVFMVYMVGEQIIYEIDREYGLGADSHKSYSLGSLLTGVGVVIQLVILVIFVLPIAFPILLHLI